jgi:hypothetical protein
MEEMAIEDGGASPAEAGRMKLGEERGLGEYRIMLKKAAVIN